jgi:hypothetical protein
MVGLKKCSQLAVKNWTVVIFHFRRHGVVDTYTLASLASLVDGY